MARASQNPDMEWLYVPVDAVAHHLEKSEVLEEQLGREGDAFWRRDVRVLGSSYTKCVDHESRSVPLWVAIGVACRPARH